MCYLNFIELFPVSMMYGIAIIRIGVGFIFTLFGFKKLKGGKPEWLWLGNQMGNFGIHFFPLFWGICAMLAEFLGGICLLFGFGTRIVVFFMIIVTLVAMRYHIKNGDGFDRVSFPLTLFFVLIGLFVAGGGAYALDMFCINY